MELRIKPTDKMESIEGVECRRWEGVTDQGTPVHVWVRMLSPQTHDEGKLAVFDRELQALPPVRKDLVYFDMRFVL